jgi:hypothetical protein
MCKCHVHYAKDFVLIWLKKATASTAAWQLTSRSRWFKADTAAHDHRMNSSATAGGPWLLHKNNLNPITLYHSSTCPYKCDHIWSIKWDLKLKSTCKGDHLSHPFFTGNCPLHVLVSAEKITCCSSDFFVTTSRLSNIFVFFQVPYASALLWPCTEGFLWKLFLGFVVGWTIGMDS